MSFLCLLLCEEFLFLQSSNQDNTIFGLGLILDTKFALKIHHGHLRYSQNFQKHVYGAVEVKLEVTSP